MQSIALGTCIHLLLGVNMKVGMIIGMAIILAYTLSSGMWGVAMTDYVQFIFLAGGVLLATAMVYSGAGGWSGITSSVPAEHLQLDTSGAIKLKILFCERCQNSSDQYTYCCNSTMSSVSYVFSNGIGCGRFTASRSSKGYGICNIIDAVSSNRN